jgi:hypothetical protein
MRASLKYENKSKRATFQGAYAIPCPLRWNRASPLLLAIVGAVLVFLNAPVVVLMVFAFNDSFPIIIPRMIIGASLPT